MVSFVRGTGLGGSGARPLGPAGGGAALAAAVARPLGRALAAAGRTGDAVDALEAAIARDLARGGVPFAARAQRDLAAVLLARGAPGDGTRAGVLLEEAAEAADRLGLVEPARRARALLAAG